MIPHGRGEPGSAPPAPAFCAEVGDSPSLGPPIRPACALPRRYTPLRPARRAVEVPPVAPRTDLNEDAAGNAGIQTERSGRRRGSTPAGVAKRAPIGHVGAGCVNQALGDRLRGAGVGALAPRHRGSANYPAGLIAVHRSGFTRCSPNSGAFRAPFTGWRPDHDRAQRHPLSAAWTLPAIYTEDPPQKLGPAWGGLLRRRAFLSPLHKFQRQPRLGLGRLRCRHLRDHLLPPGCVPRQNATVQHLVRTSRWNNRRELLREFQNRELHRAGAPPGPPGRPN